MKRVIKWIGLVLGGLLGLLVLIVIVVYAVSSSRINKTYDLNDFNVESVSIPAGAEAIARGRHLATIRGCGDCHGQNLTGKAFIDDPAIGSLYASNLTPGQGGIGSDYTDADFVRAIRHSIGPDGNPLLFMPAQEYYYLSDNDLGAIIAYLKTLPPVDNRLPENTIGPLGRILFLANQLPLVPAELIDHTASRPAAAEIGVSIEYGRYLSIGCMGCHGLNLSGGPIPGAPPDAPLAPNLTPGSKLATWSEEDFLQTLRTGVTPTGHELDSQWMPWPSLGQMTDDELKAVWLYLQSLPALETGER